MTNVRDNLRRRMGDAASALDFEEAARLRDQLDRLPADDRALDRDTPRIRPQVPGKMGLGSSEPGRAHLAGWTPPPRPDPMTRTVKGRTRKR